MNIYFKSIRAEEEIRRLNIEVRRLVTFISDYHRKISSVLAELEQSDLELAHQLRKRIRLRKQHDIIHLRRLRQLSLQDGFSGSLCKRTRIGDGEDGNGEDGDGVSDGISEVFGGLEGDDSTLSSDDEADMDLAMCVDRTMNIVLADD